MVRKMFPVLALGAVFSIPPTGASADLKEDQAFPVLALPSLADGKALSIEDFRGRKIALHVFASW